MRKSILALAAVAALSTTPSAEAAIVTTNYSVSGPTLAGTLAAPRTTPSTSSPA